MSAVCSVCVHLFLDSAQLKVIFLSTALVFSVISSTRLAYGIQTQTLAAIIETGESVVHDWTWSPRGWVTITCCCYYKLLVLGIAPTPRCWVLFRIYKSPSDETIIVLTDPQCVVLECWAVQWPLPVTVPQCFRGFLTLSKSEFTCFQNWAA